MLMGKRYWSFFHSSTERTSPEEPRRRYYMGAYSFEQDPPFKIGAISKTPLLVGSELDGGSSDMGIPLPVIFPGGAIWKNGRWTVVFGVNDERCAWIEIPHADLLANMRDIEPSTTETIYLQDQYAPPKPVEPPKPLPPRETLEMRLERYAKDAPVVPAVKRKRKSLPSVTTEITHYP